MAVPAIDAARLKVVALEARRCAEEDEAGSHRARKLLFGSFCFLEVMANFDAGVLPATISHVMTEFDLSFSDGGALGAVVYLGLVLSSPVGKLTLLRESVIHSNGSCTASSLSFLLIPF